MSIRMVAVELYRVIREIEELEKKLEGLGPGSQEREGIEKRVREAKADQIRLKSMLEGAKGD